MIIVMSVSVWLAVRMNRPTSLPGNFFITRPNFTKLFVRVNYLCQWPSRPLAALQYVMYFRFCG